MAFLPGTVPDASTFTVAVSPLTPIGGVWNDALAALTTGQIGELRITEKRAAHCNLRNEAGAELGIAAAPLRTDPTGTTKQPITLFDSAGTAITLASGRLLVDGSGVTQPVSGTLSVQPAIPTVSEYTVAAVNFSASGDNTVIAGTAAQTIRVYGIALTNAATAITLTFKDGASISLSGALSLSAMVLDRDGQPHFVTTAGNAFVINLSGTSQVSGTIWFTKS
jgi:hypothetical protein